MICMIVDEFIRQKQDSMFIFVDIQYAPCKGIFRPPLLLHKKVNETGCLSEDCTIYDPRSEQVTSAQIYVEFAVAVAPRNDG